MSMMASESMVRSLAITVLARDRPLAGLERDQVTTDLANDLPTRLAADAGAFEGVGHAVSFDDHLMGSAQNALQGPGVGGHLVPETAIPSEMTNCYAVFHTLYSQCFARYHKIVSRKPDVRS